MKMKSQRHAALVTRTHILTIQIGLGSCDFWSLGLVANNSLAVPVKIVHDVLCRIGVKRGDV